MVVMVGSFLRILVRLGDGVCDGMSVRGKSALAGWLVRYR